MPPDDSTVAPAVISKAPTTSRELAAPLGAPEGARMSPEAPVTVWDEGGKAAEGEGNE